MKISIFASYLSLLCSLELPTIPEESTSTDIRPVVPTVIPQKKDVEVMGSLCTFRYRSLTFTREVRVKFIGCL